MKNINFKYYLFLFVILLFSCEKDESEINLSGTWIGESYMCLGTVQNEIISIIQDMNTRNVVATKITGDNCVKAGMITFKGVYDGKATEFSVTFTTGTQSSPGSGQSNSKMTIINEKQLEASFENITFKKQ